VSRPRFENSTSQIQFCRVMATSASWEMTHRSIYLYIIGYGLSLPVCVCVLYRISIIGIIIEKKQKMAEMEGVRGIYASVGIAVATIIRKKVT
jgi:hypothetical protein